MANIPAANENTDPVNAQSTPSMWARLGKRAGALAFLFFFVKGLAWLVVPAALATWWAQ